MNKPGQARGGRKLVKKIVVTYVLEDDPDAGDQEMTLSREDGGEVVDGVVWSGALMDRLAYRDQPGQKVPQQPARPGDGWKRRGNRGNGGNGNGGNGGAGNGGDGGEGGSMTAMSTSLEGPDCIWLHRESCSWLSFCDPL